MQANQKRSDCMQQLSDSGLALMKIVRTAGGAAPYAHITAEPAQADRSWQKNTVITPLSLSGSAVIPALPLCGPALRPGDRPGEIRPAAEARSMEHAHRADRACLLLRYGPADAGPYVTDASTISKYRGTLSIYGKQTPKEARRFTACLF